MKKLDFPYPFSGFSKLDFTNCFTGLFMHLEGIRADDSFRCAKEHGDPCDSCGNCGYTLRGLQESLFFLFDTMSGRSATVNGWGGKPTAIYQAIYDTEDTVGFITGYAGYAYGKYSDNLMWHIKESIGGGAPALVRLKDGRQGAFRLITGYDGNKLFMADPKGAHNSPKKAPRPGEIESVYVITGKTEPKYTLPDALRRIKGVMETDRESGAWDEYIHAFENFWDRLKGHGLEALKQLHEYAYKGTTWNCHNFQQAFVAYKEYGRMPASCRNRLWEEIADPRLRELCNRIDWATDNSHTHQWQLHSLYETRNWKKRYYNELEWGMCETAAGILRQIKEDDAAVYGAICEMLAILEGNTP